jgi:LPXTG-motif cell wall-anchored protein
MNTKTYCVISGIIFLLVAMAHLLRIYNGWEVNIGTEIIPIWVSWFGLIVPALLGIWAFMLVKRR